MINRHLEEHGSELQLKNTAEIQVQGTSHLGKFFKKKKRASLYRHFSNERERERERENMANENSLSTFPGKQPCLTFLFCEFKRVSSGKFVFNIQAFKPCKLVGQWPFLFQCLLVPYLHKHYIRRAFEYNFTWIKGRTFASANQDIWLFL